MQTDLACVEVNVIPIHIRQSYTLDCTIDIILAVLCFSSISLGKLSVIVTFIEHQRLTGIAAERVVYIGNLIVIGGVLIVGIYAYGITPARVHNGLVITFNEEFYGVAAPDEVNRCDFNIVVIPVFRNGEGLGNCARIAF